MEKLLVYGVFVVIFATVTNTGAMEKKKQSSDNRHDANAREVRNSEANTVGSSTSNSQVVQHSEESDYSDYYYYEEEEEEEGEMMIYEENTSRIEKFGKD